MQLNMTGLYTKLYAITDHTPCDVDTPKRFGAYILDWVVGVFLPDCLPFFYIAD